MAHPVAPARPGRRAFGRAYAVVLVVVFGVLVLSGTTLSSLGVELLRVDGTAQGRGLIDGTPRAIRSDEFLRTSPWRIGALHDPDLSFGSPLSEDGALTTTVAGHGIATRLVFFDSLVIAVGHHTSATAAFAFLWWLPTILLFACGPPLLARIGLGRATAIATVTLVWFSPTVVWWSLAPIGTGLGYAFAAALLLTSGVEHLTRAAGAVDRRTALRAGVALAAGGILCLRVPFAYAPWSLWLAACVLVPTAAVLVQRHGWRALRLPAVALAGWVLLLGVGILVENREAFEALNATVYPGQRRETAASLDTARLFGAPFFAMVGRGQKLYDNTNESELSSGWLILLVPCVITALVASQRSVRMLRRAWWALALVTAVLVVWVTVDLPASIGERIPVIDLSPASRIAQIVGIPATLLFGLTLGGLARETSALRRRVAIATVVTCTIVLAMAGSTIRELYIPSLSITAVLLTAIGFALATGVAVLHAPRAWAMVPLVALAVGTTVHVNPIQRGFADLTNGEAARTITARQRTDPGGRWASDAMEVDAVLLANAVPSLSGQQWVGPVRDAWLQLDPAAAAEEAWNRGSSYILVQWSNDGVPPVITNPSADVIAVGLSPCDAVLDEFDVRWIVASGELFQSCLVPSGVFSLGAKPRFVYQRLTGAPPANR